MGAKRPSTDQIFNAAAELLDPAARADYLDDVCADDPELRLEIEDLLKRDSAEASFLKSPASEYAVTTDHRPIAERPGTVIGPYKLLQQIGEGGMGAVFMAEQTEPIQRTVALKIIKPGMDTRQVIARFEAERQALALMDHPNIARVLDAGTTDTGRPYFVMDLVKGVPITDYCDQQHLSVRQRLELMAAVCQAVQHAHQKGIIHRDLKPSNVLVAEYDGKPVPKVIDFGVAKATAQKLTERTMFTQYGQIVGTFEYMSPEQARFNQLDVDTRSDIYSLGVLLYEVLAGSTPLEKERLRSAAFDELLRIIGEEEPPKPSTRLSQSGDRLPSIAALRGTEPAKLSKLVRGDLDWIVLKCLEKDRNRRYDTANDLARDVERYLRDEPIEARPPSLRYRFRKLAKRNKRALAFAGLLTVLLLSALAAVAGSIGWAARDRAARQAAVEREVSLALQEVKSAYEMDAISDAMAAVNKAEAVLASGAPQPHLQRRVERWKTDLRLVERLEEIRLDKGKEPFSLGTVDAYLNALQDYGLKHLPQLLVIDMYDLADAGRSPLKPRHLQKVDVSESADLIRASQIKPHLVAALDDWAALASDHDRRVLFAIAREVDDNSWRNRLRDAIQHDDVESLRSLATEDDWAAQPPSSIAILAGHLLRLNEPELNELGSNVLRRAQQRHPDDFWVNLYLAQFLWIRSSHPDDAVGFARVAVARRPDSPGVRLALGSVLESLGEFSDAEEEFREAIRLKPDHVNAYYSLGGVCLAQRKWSEAISVYEKAIQNVPTAHRGSLYVHLAEMLTNIPSEELRNPRRAVELAGEAVHLAPKDWTATDALGMALYRAGDWQASVNTLERSFALQPGPKGRYSHDATRWFYFGMAYWQMGHKDEARAWYDKAVAWMDKHAGYKYRELVRLRDEAAELLGLPESRTDQAPTSPATLPRTSDNQKPTAAALIHITVLARIVGSFTPEPISGCPCVSSWPP